MLDPFPRAPATIARVEQPRYTAVAQALHWFTALLVLAVLPLAWVATSLPASPTKGFVFQLHKSVGITIFAIVALRILWRAWHPAPREAFVPPALALLGRINHWLLYLVFLLMPLSGFVLSAAAGNTTQYFFLFPIPPFMEKNKAVADLADQIHLAGQYAVYLLVSLHVLATAWHLIVRRDALLDRMLPRQDV
ncbi:cytochrome b [Methylobacterium indicum]|uniref:Cytochrome B561 n=1 Tax=Methylobacterium indicum TaxID=1775910 RepID=A0ABR5HI16_9HYPH|nr:cytochrome b [Methylobacterium indicum]KMO21163.1 cytochrome B561 [Methylobacterium indicum]KMO26230.1 cytochrome B561 [Methylobacterium indicum]